METIKTYLLTGMPGDLFRGNLERALSGAGYDLALLALGLGAVYLLFGWRWFHGLLTVQAVLLGFFVGFAVGGYLLVAISCGVLLAVGAGYLTWNYPRPAATGLIGVYAAVATLGVLLSQRWIGGAYADALNVSAALVAGIAMGLLVHYVRQASITALTALHGAAGVLCGSTALLLAFDATHRFMTSWLRREPLLLPVSILILGVIGAVYQWRFGGSAQSGGAMTMEHRPSRQATEKRRRLAA